MRIWAISDIHGFHNLLIPPENVDMVIVAGDMSNSRDSKDNQLEVWEFLEWLQSLSIPEKIVVAGNHDVSIERRLVSPDDIWARGMVYLEHEGIVVKGLHVWGSPYTPTFGSGWAWNVGRGKLSPYWEEVPKGLDVLITHGPPRGILDLSINRDGVMEQCGDTELWNHVKRAQPKYHIFGHIHDFETCRNAGTMTYSGLSTKFVNASCVTDRQFNYPTSNGQLIEIDN